MEAQREAVNRYVQNRGQIIAEFIEVESGRKDNRPQLRAAIEECRKHKAVLLIARLDRLARNVAFIANLMNSDVEFLAVDMPQANRLTIHILAAVAEHEREMISQRTKAALAAAKAKGIKLGNPRWKESIDRARDARGYVPAPERVISLIAEWREHGCTYRKIAAALNELHNRTPQGKQWYSSTVRTALLRNRPGVQTSLLKEARAGANPCFIQPEGVPMPSDIREAQRMIDVFTSVGARQFVVTKLDIEQKLKWCNTYSAVELRDKFPAMVRTAQERKKHSLHSGEQIMAGENLIVRPSGPDVVFVQLDDLAADQLERLRPASCLIINTSPGSHQAWIAVSGVDKAESKDFVRRVRKAVGDADMSASGATRIAGVENFKIKYAPDYPMVTIIHAAPGRVMTPERLQSIGLLAEPEPVKTPFRVSPFSSSASWPDYQKCVNGAPPNHAKDGPDISKADFFYAMLCAQRRHGVEAIAGRLMELSSKAKENGESYARITAENATAAAERGRQKNLA
jgi:DNA invertase Pin-like site-specific DNA recombinase